MLQRAFPYFPYIRSATIYSTNSSQEKENLGQKTSSRIVSSTAKTSVPDDLTEVFAPIGQAETAPASS